MSLSNALSSLVLKMTSTERQEEVDKSNNNGSHKKENLMIHSHHYNRQREEVSVQTRMCRFRRQRTEFKLEIFNSSE